MMSAISNWPGRNLCTRDWWTTGLSWRGESYAYRVHTRFILITTKIYYKINGGITGDKDSDVDTIDYKDIIWEREIRLPMSFFGFESSEYSREYVRYKNGAQVWTQDEQVETLLFNVKKLPYSLHRELKINALMSDEIKMSDYNLGNVNTYNND